MSASRHRSVMRILQAERWGAELVTEDVEEVDLQQRPFLVRTSDTEVGLPRHYHMAHFRSSASVALSIFTLSATRQSTRECVTLLHGAKSALR